MSSPFPVSIDLGASSFASATSRTASGAARQNHSAGRLEPEVLLRFAACLKAYPNRRVQAFSRYVARHLLLLPSLTASAIRICGAHRIPELIAVAVTADPSQAVAVVRASVLVAPLMAPAIAAAAMRTAPEQQAEIAKAARETAPIHEERIHLAVNAMAASKRS